MGMMRRMMMMKKKKKKKMMMMMMMMMACGVLCCRVISLDVSGMEDKEHKDLVHRLYGTMSQGLTGRGARGVMEADLLGLT
jgi:hypothetical protein